MKPPSPTPHATSIVINGKTYTGAYPNKSKMITVTTATGAKAFPIGNDSAVFRDKTLLGELVREGKA